MAFDIHKKVIVGALGCGVFFILGIGALVLIGHRSSTVGGEQEDLMLAQSAGSWDSLTHTSATDLLTFPPLPPPAPGARATGVLHIVESKNGDAFPAFGDTFPAGSPEQKDVVFTAQRVAVWEAGAQPRRGALPYPPPYVVFFRARIFFAAADDWSRHGDPTDALLALDTAFALARASLRSADLERIIAGGRIARDGLDLLGRNTVLAGGPAPAGKARAAVAAWGRFVQRLQTADHWLMAAGASSLYIDSLAGLVTDSALPVPWRAGAARAIGMGWAFNTTEEGQGVSKARSRVLQLLQDSSLPDSVTAVINRALALSKDGFMDRLREVATFRLQRQLLFRP